jgi:hypothetical protein
VTKLGTAPSHRFARAPAHLLLTPRHARRRAEGDTGARGTLDAQHDPFGTCISRRARCAKRSVRSTLGSRWAVLKRLLFEVTERSEESQRRGRDSNPRWAFDPRPLSKRVPSASRSPLRKGMRSLGRAPS